MIIDNAPSHKNDFELKYANVIFLPPYATFCIQPLESGEIISFKATYRRYF